MNGDPTIDVSVLVTMHSEGILAYKTLRNIEESIELAKRKRIKCEVLIGLDNADELTTKLAIDFKDRLIGTACTIFQTSFADPGLNRNNLFDNSQGKYIMIRDGDDLFTHNFIVESYKKAQLAKNDAVYIPQILINFDALHGLYTYIPTTSSRISKRYFFETNYYTSQYFIPRSLLINLRYQPSVDGYGYEDWWFNTMLIAKGAEFVIVPHTAFCYRRKKGIGVLAKDNTESVLIRKNELFEPNTFLQLKPKMNDNLLKSDAKIKNAGQLINRHMTLKIIEHFKRIDDKAGSISHIARRNFKAFCTLYRLNIDRFKSQLVDTDKIARDRISSREEYIAKIIKRNAENVPPRLEEIGISRQLIKEWGNLNQIEPLIRSSWDMLEYIPIISYPTESNLSDVYYNFCKDYKDNVFTDIIFVPHMVRGGAELATIHLTRTLCEQGKKVLVVSSLDTESVWGNRIQEIEGAKFIENKQLLLHVPDEQMRMLFWMRVVQYWNIKRITTINSEFGYKLITRYRRQLKDMGCKCYVHTYAFDITEDGYIFNYIPNGLVELYGAVNKYLTDSQHYGNLLKTINGFAEQDVKTLYLPVDATRLTPKTDYKRKNKIIYAARICNQKIANVAIEVGRLLGEYGIELHFYGNIDPEYAQNNRFTSMIEEIPNVKYKGSFEAFGKLPLNEYDIYLLTTRTEGLANVILEACLSNIFIISVAVGGLPECITNNKNGYLLPDTVEKFNPQAYVDAILKAYESKSCFNQKVIQEANLRIAERHSKTRYSEDVKSIMD